MAKLPNIVERDRPLWKIVYFVIRESLKGSRRYSIIKYGAEIINAVLAFAEFGAIAIIVNEFTIHGVSEARVMVLIYGFILLAVSHFVPEMVGMVSRYAFGTQNDDMMRHFQALVFDGMNRLDIGTLEQPETQNIISLMNNRGWSAFFKIIRFSNSLLRQLTSVIVSAVAFIIISPVGFLIIFIGALPTYFVERKNGILQEKEHKESSEQWRIWHIKTESILNKDPLIELKNFSLVNIFKKKFLNTIAPFHERIRIIGFKYLKNDGLAQVILTVSFLIAFGLLIGRVYQGLMPIGVLVFSLAVVSRFQSSLNQAFDTFGKMIEAKQGVDIVLDFLEMKPLVISGDKPINPTEPITVEFKKVSFAYPGSDRRVLNNISLSFATGDNIAIVGLNGAGKTTLIKLLTRVYDPTSGEILVNGIPLREYDLKSWKKCLGILLQEYSMYSEESIAENIMLGDVSKHDQGLVEQAARETTAHDFIMELPDTYQQRIGTEFRGGVELSKGQKQKVALARVLYRDAPIVVLDEPTASVDALSEDVIFKNLKQKHADQARIIISHKFSNVRDSDQIILIQDGTILEQGGHDQLMQKPKGKYRELFELQAEGYR